VPDKTEAVLRWLDRTLDAIAKNPMSALKAKGELEKNKEVVKEAVKDALLPEFEEYTQLISKFLNH